jgi:hypothetical protein
MLVLLASRKLSLSLSCFYAPYVDPPSDKELSELQGEALLGELFCERQSSGQVSVRVTARRVTKL